MYNPKYVTLPPDVYRLCMDIAHSYYNLLRRRHDIEQEIIFAGRLSDGQPRGNHRNDETADKAEHIVVRQTENERKIRAIEQAWHTAARDCTEREFIRLNLFEMVRMPYINLPLHRQTMKQVRKRFLVYLAENLHEI